MERGQLLTAEDLWTAISDRLKGALNDTTYGTWFGDAEGRELNDDAFVLAVPNDFTREWIEGHFVDLIGAAVRDATGEERRVEVRVDHDVKSAGQMEEAPKKTAAATAIQAKYTFDSFVIGSSNRFAHAAALAVAEARRRLTTRSSSMEAPDWARPTCSRRSASTSPSTPARSPSATSRAKRS